MNTPTAFLLTDSDKRDPLMRGIGTTGDVFGDMLKRPDTPMPAIELHPTKGLCLSCRKPIPNAWFGFCGGWAVHRRCDACAGTIKHKVGPQPVRQRGDRAEPGRHPWDDEEAA